MKKQAVTIPLSPEERYDASQLFGRSLFSALQLAKEQELRRNAAMAAAEGMDDEKVLRIPVPQHIMPNKVAGMFGDPAYLGGETDEEPPHGEGMLAHIKRNLGKYVGSYGGTGLGASLGVANALRDNSRSGLGRLVGRGALGGVVGGLGGAALGALLDDKAKKQHMVDMGSTADRKKRMLQAMLEEGEQEGYKYASVFDEDSGALASALKYTNTPINMILGSQAGFKDAKRDYYIQQKKKIQKELMNAQKEYIDTLGRIKTGSAESETPCVDAFCNGIAYMTVFGKTADFKEPEIEEGSLQQLLGDAVSVAKKPFQPAINAAATGLLGTGAGSAWLTYLLRKKMREEPEKYMQENLPTRVELQPYA